MLNFTKGHIKTETYLVSATRFMMTKNSLLLKITTTINDTYLTCFFVLIDLYLKNIVFKKIKNIRFFIISIETVK